MHRRHLYFLKDNNKAGKQHKKMEKMWAEWAAHGRTQSPLKYAAVRTLSELEILAALAVDGEGIRHVPLALQTEAMGRVSLQQNPRAYYFFSNPLRSALARLAVQGDSDNYVLAPKAVQDDPEVLLTALISARSLHFVKEIDPVLLQKALDLNEARVQFYTACRTAFAAGALRPGPLRALRSHGIHFLRQFNRAILAYAGFDELFRNTLPSVRNSAGGGINNLPGVAQTN
jgi:hypothetical protein